MSRTPYDPGATAGSYDAGAGVGAYDPLRLCVYATLALLGWVLGPLALAFFAGLGFVGYRRARRAGLTRSKCVLRDTRLVLGYLGALFVAGVVGVALRVAGWL